MSPLFWIVVFRSAKDDSTPAGTASHPGGPAAHCGGLGSIMFRCAICGEVSPPRTPATRVVTRRRPKKYLFRSCANELWRLDTKGKRKQHFTDDPGGAGWEIAREVMTCPTCAAAVLPQRE